jgi:hypothetical protein
MDLSRRVCRFRSPSIHRMYLLKIFCINYYTQNTLSIWWSGQIKASVTPDYQCCTLPLSLGTYRKLQPRRQSLACVQPSMCPTRRSAPMNCGSLIATHPSLALAWRKLWGFMVQMKEGMLCRVALVRTDVSEEQKTAFFIVTTMKTSTLTKGGSFAVILPVFFEYQGRTWESHLLII